ncbi:Hypothetical predicted protein [Cloeon dipterum]|uniref:Uncharacterized protein n=1 Tax=Cloeon dipterum TaxID=197152 RepID=A0A8S1C2C2_9INSE|nr:Hypothetical predicted protein [Cloeon dipterum]
MAEPRINEQRIFRKFSQWYYNINVKKDPPMPDVPELVTLLEAVGFKLTSMGLGKNAPSNSASKLSGLKLTIECAASGVVAEMESPPDVECRCSVFDTNKSDSADSNVQEKASFWTITASQENLNGRNGKIGSSLLPEVDVKQSRVIKEVFQILQDDLFNALEAKNASDRKRLSLTHAPQSNGGSNSSSIQHSMDSLEKMDCGRSMNDVTINRRASIGCGEDLKNVMPLLAQLPPKPRKQLSSSSSETDPDTPKALQNAAASPVTKSDALRKLLTSALKLLEPQKAEKVVPQRKTTFNLPAGDTSHDAAKRGAKVFGTPGPARTTGSQNVSRFTSPSVRVVSKTIFRGPATPSTMIPVASKARSVDPARRRTVAITEKSRVLRTNTLSPSAEVTEGNNPVSTTPLSLPPKPKLVRRSSLPPRPVNKENADPAK